MVGGAMGTELSVESIVCVIPARYKSSRFPGKPLEVIEDKPMIWWVYQQCKKVKELSKIIVATDDDRIFSVCRNLDMEVVMTSPDNKTGTDRVAEVAQKLNSAIIINVQGDEPFIEPDTISAVIKTIQTHDCDVASLMTKITNPLDLINPTICKVITNQDGKCIYLTRSPAPYPKATIDVDYYKALGIFAFKPESLYYFREYGKKNGKSKNESIEDIELLRFVENGYTVIFTEVNSNSIAVDVPADLERVRSIAKNRDR